MTSARTRERERESGSSQTPLLPLHFHKETKAKIYRGEESSGLLRQPLLASDREDTSRKMAYAEPSPDEEGRMRGLRGLLDAAGLKLPKNMTPDALGGERRALLKFTRARKDTGKSFDMLKGARRRNPRC